MPTRAFAVLLGLTAASGCGGEPAPAVVTPEPSRPVVEPATAPPAVPADAPKPAALPPVTGTFDGAPFTPTAALDGPRLVFRAIDPAGERSVTIVLSPGVTQLSVGPTDPPGPGVPEIEVATPPGAGKTAALRAFVNGYTLTLDLPAATGAARLGTVALTLPGEPPTGFAGAFTAAVVRGPDDPPTAADVPFIAGPVTGAGAAAVQVGYLALIDGELVTGQVTGPDQPAGGAAVAVRAEAAAYVRSANAGDRYEFTRLPPGRYLVYARSETGGVAAWRYLDVPAGGQVAAPLPLGPAATAKVTVTVPAGVTAPVTLYPADDKPGTPLPDEALAATFVYRETPANGAATFAQVAAGRYRVVSPGRGAVVTVTAGQPAAVDLTK